MPSEVERCGGASPARRPLRSPVGRRYRPVRAVSVAGVTIILVTAVMNAAVAVGDLVRARFVLATSEQVRVPVSWLPALGAAKLAGAAGLVGGLLGLRPIGIAGAAGLTLFFGCAIGRHVQTGVLRSIAFPGAFLLLALASLLLFVRG